MATIVDILKDGSQWAWNIMKQSSELGEMIREDAITSVLLAMINQAVKQNQIDLSITSFQGAHLEKEYGADWAWALQTKLYLVQAKRLDVVRKANLMSYTIDLEQLDSLIDAAQMLQLQPVYVFYNTIFDNTTLDPKDYGCLYVYATNLQSYIYDVKKVPPQQSQTTLRFSTLQDLQAKPWYYMFT